MLDTPVIVPGPDPVDAGGVEDPTVEQMPDGSYVVYYSAVAADMAHSQLSYAQGPSVDRLTKSGIALESTKTMGNTKEATVGHTADGHWRLFYEYAADNASRVGLAIGARGRRAMGRTAHTVFDPRRIVGRLAPVDGGRCSTTTRTPR